MDFPLEIRWVTPAVLPRRAARAGAAEAVVQRTNPLERLTIVVSVEGVSVVPTSLVRGRATFLIRGVSSGSQVELRATIPGPTRGAENLLELVQPLVVEEAPSGASLVAGHTQRFREYLHPRLRIRGPNSGARPALAIGPAQVARVRVRNAPVIVDLDLEFFQVRLRGPDPGTHGCTVHLLYHARRRPPMWYVAIPPAARQVQRPSVIQFFRPRGQAYVDHEDMDTGAFWRYAGDGPADGPSFWRNGAPAQYPHCGWLRQLVDSQVPAIYVHPMPVEGSYGLTDEPAFLPALDSLLRALWGDGHLGVDFATGVCRNKLAVMMYSFGGGPGFNAVRAFGSAIDELYLLDPNGLGEMGSTVSAWYRRGGKRLCMVGGYEDRHAAILQIAHSLSGYDGVVQVWPETRAYWIRNRLWSHAWADPAHGFDLAAWVGQADTDITRRMGIRCLVQPSAANPSVENLWIQLTTTEGEVLGPIEIGRCCPGQIGWYLWRYRTSGVESPMYDYRPETIEELRDLATSIQAHPFGDWAHQWVVFGGLGNTENRSECRGHFLACLHGNRL